MVKADDCADVSVRYSLSEIDVLAKQWADANEATTDARWIVSGFLAWLINHEAATLTATSNVLAFELPEEG